MFLGEPPRSDLLESFYSEERRADGYVRNTTRVWCWRPDVLRALYDARSALMADSELSWTDAAVLFTAAAAAREDSYCALHWGGQVVADLGSDTAVAVVRGDLVSDPRVAALAHWARRVATNPNAVSGQDVDALRAVGLTDKGVCEATMLVAWRLAFLTVNDALGAAPDAELAAAVPSELRAAVSFGRPPAEVSVH